MHALKELAIYFHENNILYITIARRDIRKVYNNKILQMYKSYGLDANFSDHNREKSLQIADFYSWAIFSNFEHDISEYFLKLEHLIILIKTKLPTGL
jgi:hypothetical protein